MLDDVSDIASYYDRKVRYEQNRLEIHQLERDLTWRYLERYLPPRGSILEIGAATGAYTLELARRGYAVTAVDLSAVQLEECRSRLAKEGLEKFVQLVVSDARDLSEVREKEFDAVLLMGPLYHLVEDADRKAALRQAFERLKAGGILVSSLIPRLGGLSEIMKENPAWIEDRLEVRSFLDSGMRPQEYPHGGFRGYFVRVPEIAPLHEEIGLETLAVAGVEPAIAADDESYNKLQGDQRRLWLDLLEEISREESILGASRHLLYVGRKNHSNWRHP